MRWVGILLSLGVMAVSGLCNARYGMSLARDGFDKYVMIAVAVFADVGKAVTWIFFAGALARREVLAAAGSLLIFSACLLFAVSGSLGFVAMNRAQSTASVEDKGKLARDVESELQRKRTVRDGLGLTEPAGVIEKNILALKQDRRFTSSRQCMDATSEGSRTFCAGLARLEGEMKKAEAAAALDGEIENLRQRRMALAGTATVDRGDFQGSLIAQLTNLNLSTVQLSLAVLFVVMVESGSCFLLWLSLNHGAAREKAADVPAVTPLVASPPALTRQRVEASRPRNTQDAALKPASPAPLAVAAPKAEPEAGDFVEFVSECIELGADGTAEVDAIAARYKSWCMEKNRPALADELIAAGLDGFCRAGRIKTRKTSGRLYLVGIRLRNKAISASQA